MMTRCLVSVTLVLALAFSANGLIRRKSPLPKNLVDSGITHPWEDESRIVGGTETKPHAYPFQVSVQTRSGSHSCGGSILDENNVMTAAHCCTTFGGLTQVVIGEHNLREEEGVEQTIQIDQKIQHEDYQSSTFNNDICILRLASPIKLDDKTAKPVVPIAFPEGTDCSDESQYLGKNWRVIGWGTLEAGGFISQTLQEVDVPYVDRATCDKDYGLFTKVTDQMVCAGKEGFDSCQGDSGGPILFEPAEGPRQVGIVSWGRGCAAAGYPGVYTNVACFGDWIEGKLSGN